MVDPHIGLVSFQQAFARGELDTQRGRIHPQLVMMLDDAGGGFRLTYAVVEGKTVKALAMYVMNGMSEGKPYFQVGYAVAEDARGQGFAQKVVQQSIDEITAGFKGKIPSFYIEAVVSISNLASKRVAEKLIGGEPEELTDNNSGEPAVRYTKLVGG